MIQQLYVLLVLIIPVGQICAQDLNELEKRNGFKDIKLGSEVGSYPFLEMKKSDDNGVVEYVMRDDHYKAIGNIKIHNIRVLALRGVVYEIYIITEKDENLYKGLVKAFGNPQNRVGHGVYSWLVKDKLSLTFESYSRNKLQMRYHSYVYEQMRKNEKKEEIEDISSDF